MSRFPVARMALARIFANLAIVALPRDELDCLNTAFYFADQLKARAVVVKDEAELAA